jgi:hypothetical protein
MHTPSIRKRDHCWGHLRRIDLHHLGPGTRRRPKRTEQKKHQLIQEETPQSHSQSSGGSEPPRHNVCRSTAGGTQSTGYMNSNSEQKTKERKT